MFSKFFEKNKSNGQLADYFKKKRKDNPQPNVSCVNIARHLASTSNSPAPSKQTKHERQNSPGQLVKQTQSNSGRPSTTKTSVKKIKRIERPEAPSKDKLKDLEKSKLGPSSKSPKLARPAFQDFFSSKGLKGISQLAANLKKNREMKPRTVKETQKTLDDSMKMRSSSKKLQKSQTTSSMSTRLPKAFTPLSNVSKKVSRESSQKQKRFSEGGNIVVKKTVSDVSKLLEKEKVRHNNNSLFLSAAKRNEAEKCLQLISGATLNQQGADINCQDREGWTAIHHACWNENLKLVNILLYNDAKLDLPDSGGVRPISLAVSRGNAMITRVGHPLI
jgi:hypothetical protein